MHRGVNAARVGRLTGEAQIAIGIPSGKIGWSIEALDGIAGDRREFGLALGTLFERGAKRILFPGKFLGGRLARNGRRVKGGNRWSASSGFFTHGMALPIRLRSCSKRP